MQTAADIDALISLAYDAVADMARWPEVLSRTAALIGADAVVQISGDASLSGLHRTELLSRQHVLGLDVSAGELYAELAPSGPVAIQVATTPAGSMTPIYDMMAKPDFERSAFFDRWVRPHGMADALIGPLTPLGPGMAILNFMRATGTGQPFSTDDAMTMRYMPHLSRAFRLAQRLDAAGLAVNGVPAAMLNALSVAIICIADSGRVLWANEAAETLLAKRDGLVLGQDGRLAASSSVSASALGALLADTAAGLGAASNLMRPSGKLDLCVTSYPLRKIGRSVVEEMLGARKAAAGVLVVHDPHGRLSPAESDGLSLRLSRLYGLTPAEAVAAVMITRRSGLVAVARELGVSHSTVHTHLRHAFQKMGAKGQVEVSRRVEALRLLYMKPSV